MPIPFGCDCGKKLQAKDEFAGRKLRCPGCGKVLTIPGPRRAPSTTLVPRPALAARLEPPAPSPPPPPPRVTVPPPPPPPVREPEPEPVAEVEPPVLAAIRYVCSCGRRLKSMPENAGDEIECPGCGRSLVVPDRDTDIPPPPAELMNPWFDPFLGQTVTPWRADLDPAHLTSRKR